MSLEVAKLATVGRKRNCLSMFLLASLGGWRHQSHDPKIGNFPLDRFPKIPPDVASDMQFSLDITSSIVYS